jgi:hypothetical protein
VFYCVVAHRNASLSKNQKIHCEKNTKMHRKKVDRRTITDPFTRAWFKESDNKREEERGLNLIFQFVLKQ